MAGKRLRDNGTWEYVFKRKGLLPEPVYFTFDTEEEGDRYAQRAEEMLGRGVVPLEMTGGAVRTLDTLCDLYEEATNMSRSEKGLLPVVRKSVEGVRIEKFSYAWVESWVAGLQASGKAPSTVSKRVGGLARVIDWAMRREYVTLAANPLRLLPRGYCGKDLDRNQLYSGERDRIMDPTEEGAIRSVLADKNEALLFDMAIETGMRLGEMFTLKVGQIDLERRTIFLHESKNGSKRQVPISSVLLKKLQAHLVSLKKEAKGQNTSAGVTEYLFPEWWQGGTQKDKERVGHMLSHRFAKRFEQAVCPDLRFHDLRHTAITRFYERTTLSDVEIAKISGHKSLRMLTRYANIRGSDLAAKMW